MALPKKDYEKALSHEYGFPVFLTDKEYARLSATKPAPVDNREKHYEDPFEYAGKKLPGGPEDPWKSNAPGGAAKVKNPSDPFSPYSVQYNKPAPAPGPTSMGGPSVNPWYQPKPGVSAPMDPSLPNPKMGMPTNVADVSPMAALAPTVAPMPKKPPVQAGYLPFDVYGDAWGK